MTAHLAGREVSKSTYCNHGCRCDGCRAANTKYHREYRRGREPPSAVAARRATTQAAKWVRDNRPDIWIALVNEQYKRIGTNRRPVGRPKKKAAA